MVEFPLLWGESPFHCKGVLYVDTLRYFDTLPELNRAKLLRSLRDPSLREFLEQPFGVGGWYDAMPMAAFYRAAMVFTGRPALDLVRDVARWQLPHQLGGIYKFLLKLASPDLIMTQSVPRAAVQYYDFVTATVRRVRERTYESHGAGVPAVLAPAYMASTEVALTLMLEAAGARAIRHRWLPPEPGAPRAGIPTVCVRREVSWAA